MRGLGETAPTAGLPPRWRDLAPGRQAPLEDAICRTLGLADLVITGSGSAALAIAFEHLRRRHPDRRTVIVPGYTCPLVVLAAAARGLTCIACDTAPSSFDLDISTLERLLGPDTLAIVPTHYGGALTNVAAVRDAAAAVSPHIAVIEDAAQAFGATVDGTSVGLAGDVGVFSFGAGKGFTVFEGGGLVARDAETLASLRQIAAELSHGSVAGELWRQVQLAGYHAAYRPLGLRLVYGAPKRYWLRRHNDMQAAGDIFDPEIPMQPVGAWRQRVGAAALPRLTGHLAACRAQHERLAGLVAHAPFMARSGAHLYLPRQGEAPTCSSLFLTLPEATSPAAIEALWQSRLGMARMFTRAIGDYPDLKAHLQPASTPGARVHAARTITLSTDPTLSLDQLAATVAFIKVILR